MSTNIQHGQQRRRTIIPAGAVAAVFILILVGMFSLGFFAGSNISQEQPAKIAAPAFEKTAKHFKMQQPIFEHPPEELP